METDNKSMAYSVIAIVSFTGIVGVLILDPIAQDPVYHVFKDQRTVFSIPNFWNIISNLLFLYAGIKGLQGIFGAKRFKLIDDMKGAYILFFIALLFVAIGSGYYHLSPDNASLVWDRLPMTIAFMALFSIIIGEFISVQLGKLIFWPLVFMGVFSVIYWQYTEAKGIGDLRYYILVQFLPVILIPLILLLFKSQFTLVSGYWILLSAYIFAKVFEFFDVAIYNLTLLLSGHSLKHIAAAIGILFLLSAYKKREQRPLE